jgi:hypothetical protein
VKLRAWTEHQTARTISTADGPIIVHEGDFVVIAVVKRWEDASKALAAIAALSKPEEP